MAATEVGTRRLSNFVNGKRVDPQSGSYAQIINPSTGEAYIEAPLSNRKAREVLGFKEAHDWRRYAGGK